MEKLLLVDGHSILSRAYFGIPRLSTGDGRPTNAVYGFMNILLKVIAEESPDKIAVAFDLDRKKLKRTAMFPDYKGTRKPMPDDLHVQVPVMQELLKCMNVPVVTLEGYEADDILGTIAFRAADNGMEVSILSGDRDLLQLSSDHIKIIIPKTSKGATEVFRYYPDDVKKEYKVTPKEFIDVKALMGDTSDNIPGLPGVGEKTATEIIEKFGSIENALEHVDEIRPPRAQNAFRESFDLAVLSKKLATIDTDSPVSSDLSFGSVKDIYTAEALKMLRDLELKTLISRFQSNQSVEEKEEISIPEYKLITDRFKASVVFNDSTYENVIGLSLYYSEDSDEPVQLSLFDNEPAAKEGKMVLSLCFGENRFVVIDSGDKYPASVMRKDFDALLEKWISKKIKICSISLKPLLKLYPQMKNAVNFDVSVASYLLNPLRESYTYDLIAKDFLGFVPMSAKELVQKGELYSPKIIAMEAYVALHAESRCVVKLKESGMLDLYNDIELPLISNLSEMEDTGVRVDRSALKAYSEHLKEEIADLEEEIHSLAGEPFNINSPIQLGNILFEKLGLPGGKKTKKGFSTSADILEKIREEHPIIPKILRYRTLTKLNSTYAEGLAQYISEDGRIHGTFHQTVTATGRISSADPNLQNIPVRTEEGREIRKVFVPDEGFTFTDADYSQVELRILASLSGDENLISAYENSVDIHTVTASKVFHVDIGEVTPEMRRNAKAVNFGIVYGISAFGLGEGLSISRKEALEYINTYFETYPGVKKYLDEQVRFAKDNGYVKTMFGRIRPIPELKSSNFMERSFGERIAMNSPIQGTAADIIKIAMNRVSERLSGMKSRIVLQVHDELLVETAFEETEEVKQILKDEMEHAADLAVSLKVEVETGDNWNECH